jgi:hypothetical protein
MTLREIQLLIQLLSLGLNSPPLKVKRPTNLTRSLHIHYALPPHPTNSIARKSTPPSIHCDSKSQVPELSCTKQKEQQQAPPSNNDGYSKDRDIEDLSRQLVRGSPMSCLSKACSLLISRRVVRYFCTPMTPKKSMAQGSYEYTLSSSVGTLRSYRNASSPIDDAGEGDITSLAALADKPTQTAVEGLKGMTTCALHSVHTLTAIGQNQAHAFSPRSNPRKLRCARLDFAPSKAIKAEPGMYHRYTALSPKTLHQPMSPTLDDEFKFVEDVKYEHNTAGYRRQIF